MFRTLRPYLIAVVCSWLALLVTATIYSREHPSFHWIWAAALPAFMLETLFYLSSVFENTRSWFANLPGASLWAGLPAARQVKGAMFFKGALLWTSAILPYLVFTLAAGSFESRAFYLLALLTSVLVFWHVLLPRRLVYDLGFLVVAAAPFITKVFARIYLAPASRPMDILGHLMWIRIGLLALVVLRQWDAGPVSLWPKKREWGIGALWFAMSIVPLLALALAVSDIRFDPRSGPWWQTTALAVGIFFGSLWVVCLGEELFFRGVIERGLLKAGRSGFVAVSLASLAFGSAHLWFHHFPNWRHSLVATALGVACGLAYIQAGSIRASMVTHSFAIVTWRILFIDSAIK